MIMKNKFITRFSKAQTLVFPIVFLLFLLYFPLQVLGQEPGGGLISPEKVGISSDSLKKMSRYLRDFVDQKRLAGVQSAVLRYGKLLHFDSYGYADIEEGIPLTEESIFRIFSMTKPIVSVGLMQLFESGHFKLNDPISKYLPEFRDMTTLNSEGEEVSIEIPILIIDLLRHTSGLGYGRGQNSKINSLYEKANLNTLRDSDEFIKRLAGLPLYFEPGTDWEYGYSTDVCGYLIEKLTGQSLDQYLKENIFEPLEMKDTYFQIPEEKVQFFTVGYSADANGNLTVAESSESSRFINGGIRLSGGGGLVSTTFDYIKFCKMLYNGGILNGKRIIKKETIDLMIVDQTQEAKQYHDRLRFLPGETGFGLGFSVAANNNSKNGVYGWGGAVGTYFRIDPKKDLIYILMIQMSPYRQLRIREGFQSHVNSSVID